MSWFYNIALILLPLYFFWLGFTVFVSEKMWRKKERDREVCRLEYTRFPTYRLCYCIVWLIITGGQAVLNYSRLQYYKTVKYEHMFKGYVVFFALFALTLVHTLYQHFHYPHTYITERGVYMGGNFYPTQNYTYRLLQDSMELYRGRNRAVKGIIITPGERERAEQLLQLYYTKF